MNNPRDAFAILGASLLVLALMLVSRRDPLREDKPHEAAGTRDSAGNAVSWAPMETKEIPADHEGKSSIAGELLHDDPDIVQSTPLWLVGPYGDPGQEPPRVPLPLTADAFERSGLYPGEYAIEGDCAGRSVKRSFMILVNGERKTIELDLRAVRPGSLRGCAFLDDKQHPLTNEKLFVSLVTWQTSFGATVTTGPDGSFELAPESNFWSTARFFRNAPSSSFVEVENTGSRHPLELIFSSTTGRKGLLMTAAHEPLPHTDFSLRAADRPDLRYWKTSDERGEFPADDIVPGEYRARATSPSSAEIAATVSVSDADPFRIVLPLHEYVLIKVIDEKGSPVSRGYFYHVHCTSMDEDLWDIWSVSPTPMGASGSGMASREDVDGPEAAPSGATVLGLPATAECTVEVLDLVHGWGRSSFELPHATRDVPVRLATPVEIEIAVFDASGSPVENPVFRFPGFHENAPLLPGGGQRFFDSLSESIGFDLKPRGEAGKFKVRLAPGSTVSVEAPGRGKVICEADRILKERAVVLE